MTVQNIDEIEGEINLSDDYFEYCLLQAMEADKLTGNHPFACSCDDCWYSQDDDNYD